MTEKDNIYYTDIVLRGIEDFNAFSIKDILFKQLPTETKEEKDLFFDVVDSVKLYGCNNDIFIIVNKNGWFKLTEKGKDILNKGGIENFNKKIEKTENLEIKIKELTVKNLELENKHFKRYVLYSIISFIAGALVTNIEDILILLNLNPK
jgi:hypothetical protein